MENNLKLKITGCDDNLLWYADKIGSIVPFVREKADYYLSKEPAGYLNIVYKKDAKIIRAEEGIGV